MNTHINEKWLQPELWQRVVDGELSRVELRELVRACEEYPELWKCCAIAFLEEQTLERELKELNTQWPATATDAGDRSGAAPERSCISSSDATRSNDSEPARKRATARRQADARATIRHASPRAALPSHWLNHFALAASLMLSCFIGWQGARRFGSDGPLQAASQRDEIQSGGNGAVTQPGSPYASVAEHAGETGDARLDGDLPAHPALVSTIPLVEVSADAIQQALQRAEQFVPLDRSIPQQLVDLEQRGLVRIESIEGFVPVRLRDGNTAVVPVQQIELRPARNAY